MKNKINIIFLLLIILTSFVIVGCSKQEKTKEYYFQYLDNYLQKIENKQLEYSLVLIEYEIEQAKIKINNEENIKEIEKIKDECIKKVKSLIIKKQKINRIKKAYWTPNIKTVPSDNQILYFLGKYGETCVFMMKWDHMFDVCTDRLYEYIFSDFPARISVYYFGTHYNLGGDSIDKIERLISKQEAEQIYKYYEIVCEDYRENQ